MRFDVSWIASGYDSATRIGDLGGAVGTLKSRAARRFAPARQPANVYAKPDF